MKKHLMLCVLATLRVAAVAPAGSAARAEWAATNLHPAGAPNGSWLFGVAEP